jgi:hypothetical protein
MTRQKKARRGWQRPSRRIPSAGCLHDLYPGARWCLYPGTRWCTLLTPSLPRHKVVHHLFWRRGASHPPCVHAERVCDARRDFLRHRADDRSTSSLPLYTPGSSSYKLIATSKTFRVYSFGSYSPDIDTPALVLSHHVRYDGPASY